MEIPSLEALKVLLERFRLPLLVGLGGIILVGLGIFLLNLSQPEGKIEIISGENQESSRLVVDLGGAVEKPGVYELPAGSRLQDLLIEAGGLSAEADRVWVEKNLNRAQRLTDGVKIYVPRKGEQVKSSSSMNSKSTTGITSNEDKLVNINNATQAELDTLWGVGLATAQKIIENRPYQAVNDLLAKKILKSNVYQRISDQLTVW